MPGEELKLFFEKQVALEEGAWEAFEKIIRLKTLRKHEHFLMQGEVCRRLGFIVNGYTRVYYAVKGEEITKDFNFEQSFCGSYASFSVEAPSRFNVVAMEEVRLYTIGRNDLYRLFDAYPSLQKMGRLSMEHMFIRKEERESSFLLDTPRARYDQLLLRHPQIVQRVPLKYLASYLGMRPETLSRIRGK